MRGWYEVSAVSTEQCTSAMFGIFFAICYGAFPSARYNSYDF